MARALFFMCLLFTSCGFGAAECSGAQCPNQDDRQALLQSRVNLDDETSNIAEEGMIKDYGEEEDDEGEVVEDAGKDEGDVRRGGKGGKGRRSPPPPPPPLPWTTPAPPPPPQASSLPHECYRSYSCQQFFSHCCNNFVDVRKMIESNIKNDGWAGKTIDLKTLIGTQVKAGLLNQGNLKTCRYQKPRMFWWWLASWANQKQCIPVCLKSITKYKRGMRVTTCKKWGEGGCVTFSGDLDQCGTRVMAEISSKTLKPAADGSKGGFAEMTSEANGTKQVDHGHGLDETLSDKRTC